MCIPYTHLMMLIRTCTCATKPVLILDLGGKITLFNDVKNLHTDTKEMIIKT